MRCLLDSHALLWFIADLPLLSDKARSLMSDPANDIAQAQVEGLTIVSRDGQFAAYPVAVVW